jgi:hypothetical protein
MAINITDTNKTAFTPDTTLNQPIPMDLSGIKASVDGITKSVADLLAGYNAAGQTKIEAPKQPAQTSVLDRITKQAQTAVPTKTTADYIAEQAQLRTDFLSSQGITQEDFTKRNELASQMASLNQQLQQKEILEQQKDLALEQQFQGRLTSVLRGEKALLQRQMAIEKASIATQIAGLSAEYQLIQGNIEEANKYFNQAIDYATQKERQDVEDYRWALGFYADIDKADRDYLQQEFENKLAIEQDKREQKRLELAQMQEARLSGVTTGTEDTFTDTVNYLKQLRDSGKLSDFSYKEQINALMQVGGYTEQQRGQVESMVNQAMEGKIPVGQALMATPEQTTQSWFGSMIDFVGAPGRALYDAQNKEKQAKAPTTPQGFPEGTIASQYGTGLRGTYEGLKAKFKQATSKLAKK